jgi:hypothetical protein
MLTHLPAATTHVSLPLAELPLESGYFIFRLLDGFHLDWLRKLLAARFKSTHSSCVAPQELLDHADWSRQRHEYKNA